MQCLRFQIAYLYEAVDLAHLRDSDFVERFLEVPGKLRLSVKIDRQTNKYGRVFTVLRSIGETVLLSGLRAATRPVTSRSPWRSL